MIFQKYYSIHVKTYYIIYQSIKICYTNIISLILFYFFMKSCIECYLTLKIETCLLYYKKSIFFLQSKSNDAVFSLVIIQLPTGVWLQSIFFDRIFYIWLNHTELRLKVVVIQCTGISLLTSILY